jgi:glutathione synthase
MKSKKRHILLIDPLEKLVIKKDSSLMLALEFQKQGFETYVVFEKDFFVSNSEKLSMKLTKFSGSFKKGSFYLENFSLEESEMMELGQEDVFHMRLDPPFDTRYLRILWMLGFLERRGVEVVNKPQGILLNNEKLVAYQHPSSLKSYVGASLEAFLLFCQELKSDGHKEMILKPLDLYQGIGVKKLDLSNDLEEVFKNYIEEFKGAVVAQPFCPEVYDGEIRTIYFKGQELGTILKTPPKGEYLANIAQGASYKAVALNEAQRSACHYFCEELAKVGVDWIAFDILGNHVSEVNVTCPGLLVEVSEAVGKNLALEIINKL